MHLLEIDKENYLGQADPFILKSGARYYIYSGTEGKVFEFDLEILGRQAVHDKNIPLAFPLDENGVPLHGGHLREVSLEEAGMAPGVSAADTDVVL